uniref:Putative endodeoxyribonuclease n=1 Tax=viral metagenome TaxID=1070528 RepID=A0A6H1ZX94_9ZZZZ
MKITIPGKPIAKRRPRFVRRGKFVGTYNDQQTEEGQWILDAKPQVTEKMEGPLVLNCLFIMPIPKGTSKKQMTVMLETPRPHDKKPDLDNLIKFVKDCLNELAWRDDSQIAQIGAMKVYGENPMTEIFIRGWKPD